MRRLLGLASIAILVAGCAIAASPTALPATPTGGVSSQPPSVTPPPSPSPSATASPADVVPCDPAGLAARITRWEGAAGSWIAHVELTNTGSAACLLASLVRPQLVDATGAVLIERLASPVASPSPAAAVSPPPATLTLAAGARATTLVRVGNYCGPEPAMPLGVAFVLPAGGRIVASPPSPTDSTVPACMGGPGSVGSIEMQAWAI